MKLSKKELLEIIQQAQAEEIRKVKGGYKVFPKKEDDNIIVTFSGNNLNAYGNSKKSGSDGLQEAMLMALYRALEGKRKKICQLVAR